MEYLSDYQGLWSEFAYAQSGLGLCFLNITHCWKSHFWTCAVEQVRQSLCWSTMPNVSLSRCAYASFSQDAYLLRSFINITQVSNLLPGIIYRQHNQVLYAKPKNEVLFVRIKLLYAELSPFQIQLCMVQLSQILKIRHLEI